MTLRTALALFLALAMPVAPAGAATDVSPLLSRTPLAARFAQEVPVPDPAALRADWWAFFLVTPDLLGERVAQVMDRLDRRIATATRGGAAAARAEVEKIRVNLRTYQLAAGQPDPVAPLPKPLEANYTPARLVEIDAALRSVTAELEFERDDVAALRAAVTVMLERMDTHLAGYLQMDAVSPERAQRGLEIMAERSAAAVAEQRLRIKNATLAAREKELQQLAETKAAALDRLSADATEIRRLAAEIESAREALDAARTKAAREGTRANQSVGASAEDLAAARYRQQRAVRAGLEAASAQVRLIELRAQLGLARLLADDKSADLGDLRSSLAEWTEELATLRRQANGWIRESERERERVAESTSGAGSSTTLTAVHLIDQDRLRLAQQSIVAAHGLQEQFARPKLLLEWVDLQLSRAEGTFGGLVAGGLQTTRTIWANASEVADKRLFKLGDTPITAAGAVKVLLTLVIAWLFSYVLRQVLRRIGRRLPAGSEPALYAAGRLSHYMIILIGLIIGLSSIGLDLTNFALIAGALALGIGFGLQSIVNNFLSGLILLFERAVKVGDYVELDSGVTGEIKAINVRATVVSTNESLDVIVPNSQFVERKVINWTMLDPNRRVHVPFRVAYEADEDKVVEAGLDAAGRLPHTLLGVRGREARVWLVGFGENGLDCELVVWVKTEALKRPAAVKASYLWEIRKALRRHGIEVPLPQRELRMRGAVSAIQMGPGLSEPKP